jgi:hypothetical protein
MVVGMMTSRKTVCRISDPDRPLLYAFDGNCAKNEQRNKSAYPSVG